MADKKENVQYFGASNFEISMISLTQVATNLFNVLMTMVTYMATGGWGLATMLAAQISAAMRMWDGVSDPIFSWFVPKVRTKIGVATPTILAGWILEVVSLLMIFNVLPSTQNVVLYVIFYFINVIGYTFLNKGITLLKLNVTNDPKRRPMFQRYNQTFVMLCTMGLSIYRANYLVPKFGGLKPGAFSEMCLTLLVVTGVMMAVGLFFARKYDNVEDFERNYHGATNFKLKDIWNLIAHNRAFLMEVISAATDKIATQTAGNTAVQTLLFGIIIANYGFTSSISVVSTVIALCMIWFATGRAGRKGSKDAYVKLCWLCIAVSAVTCIFLAVIDPTTISKSAVPTVIFVVLYSVVHSMNSSTNAVVKSMELDIQDYEFYLNGKYLGPLVTSVAGIFSKVVDSFSNIILAACIGVLGYVDTMPQPDDPSSPMLFWITMFLWLGMPVLGYIASIIAMKWYPLTDEMMVEVQRKNNERKAQNAAAYEAELAAKNK